MPNPTPSTIIALTINGRTVRVPTGTTILAGGARDRDRHPDDVLPPEPDRQRRLPSVRGRGGGRRTLQPACVTRSRRTWSSTPRPTACTRPAA